MSSIRVSPALLARLHEAAPPGTSLGMLLERLLQEAGGPAHLRERLERERRQAMARVRVERLRRAGHRSLALDPDAQVGLAVSARTWTKALETEGLRIHQAGERRLVLKQGRPARSGGPSIELRRTGLGQH